MKKKWASNVVSGVGYGTKQVFSEVGKGISGVVMDPYRGAKSKGIKGGTIGIGKGIAGLLGRPIKGGFFLMAQPIVGVVNTPMYIRKKLKKPKNRGQQSQKPNFKTLGIEEDSCSSICPDQANNEGLFEDDESFYTVGLFSESNHLPEHLRDSSESFVTCV